MNNLTELHTAITTLLNQPTGIAKDYQIGTLLTQARVLHSDDQSFGEWRCTNLSHLHRNTARNYMQLSRFNNVNQAKLIGKSKCYGLSDEMVAKVNASTAEDKESLWTLAEIPLPNKSKDDVAAGVVTITKDTYDKQALVGSVLLRQVREQQLKIEELEALLSDPATDTSESIEPLESTHSEPSDPFDDLESLFGLSVSETPTHSMQLKEHDTTFKSRLGLDELTH